MSAEPVNIHGTAIVIGTKGLVFIGPSGSGKSMLAFACLAAARRCGLYSALVGDDRILVSRHGGQIVARGPETIAGLVELRGSGIVRTDTLSPALLHYAVMPVAPATADRLPAEAAVFTLFEGAVLPLLHLPSVAPDPLAILSAFIPFYRETPL